MTTENSGGQEAGTRQRDPGDADAAARRRAVQRARLWLRRARRHRRVTSQLGVDEHAVVKTLVMQDDKSQPLIVLMHGDRQVSTKNLARAIAARSVEPCAPAAAERASGYQVGGTSPFACRKPMPVYVEATVLGLERIFINGGRRGFLIGISPLVLVEVLAATPVHCAL